MVKIPNLIEALNSLILKLNREKFELLVKLGFEVSFSAFFF